ncbi:WD40 repeat-like protein [Suillus weaverae]|nr:WD40 repeat-like protein [Suillus weaverae]
MAARFFARGTRKEASTPAQSKRPILKHEFKGHEMAIWGFVFLHDNVHIVSGSEDGTIRKWNCNTGLVVGKTRKGEAGSIYALALSPDGRIIACGRESGNVERWATSGKKMKDVWTGHEERVRSLLWSPSGRQIASGSEDGTILIRNADSGEVEVGPIKAKQGWVYALAFSPSGNRIASGGYNTICIWDTKTGELIVGPIDIEDLGLPVTSLVWSSDNNKLYSASNKCARVFDSTSGKLLHRLEHHHSLYSIALSPKDNVLACVGINGIAQLWDIESYKPLGLPLHDSEDHKTLHCVSFSRDGRYVAYGGDNGKLTLWTFKDIAPQLPAPTLLQKSDRRSTQQETRPNSPSSCLDVDATGGGGFIEEAHDDPYNNFFQSSQQSLPSPSPGSHLSSLFSARRLLNVFSRRRPPPDESVPQERSKRKFFARRARSDSPLEPATIIPNQPVPEGKVPEGEDEQSDIVDDHASTNDSLSARKDKGKEHDNPSADAQSPSSDHHTPTAHLNSEDHRNLWKRLLQPRGKTPTSGSPHYSTGPTNTPQQILSQLWHWNSSVFPVGSSSRPVDVAACREEDRYGIAPESDAEAAAAMLRPNDDVADSSTQPGQLAVGAQVSQGRPTQTQASTNGSEEIEVSCCGFVFSCRRRSN